MNIKSMTLDLIIAGLAPIIPLPPTTTTPLQISFTRPEAILYFPALTKLIFLFIGGILAQKLMIFTLKRISQA